MSIGSLSDWAARNFILNILTFDLRKIASPRHSDLPERRIVDGLTVPAKTNANVPINSATHFFITLNKLLFVYPFCSPHRNDEVIEQAGMKYPTALIIAALVC